MIKIIIRKDQHGTEVDVRRVSGLLFWKKDERLGCSGIPSGHEEGLRFAYDMALHTAESATKRGEGPVKIIFQDGFTVPKFVPGASFGNLPRKV